jgi:hypothetical protein
MKEEIDLLISYVQSSLYLCNEACNELWHITHIPATKEEYDIVSGPPFRFYEVTLQYCFVMEYARLLDTKQPKLNENSSSLFRLNISVFDFLGDKFNVAYLKNEKILDGIIKSELFIRFKKLRDKKFGLPGQDEGENAREIQDFTGEQLEETKLQIETLLNVFNVILLKVKGKGASFLLHNDDRTGNFIRYQARYKQYYFKNLRTATSEGYGLPVN